MAEWRVRLASFIVRAIAGQEALAAISADLTAESGWNTLGGGGRNERDAYDAERLYNDALEAWRKNPYAKRIIDLITDYTLGDEFAPEGKGQLGRFLDTFWNHRQNRMDIRLPRLVDELTRAGDIFVVLFRNPQDGMSYVRTIPKPEIVKIVTAKNDWETELEYHERQPDGEPRVWYSAFHPAAAELDEVMLHYSINRPVGALMGESDLATVIPWLLRYSRMLEDRVKLNWAARVFYWFVKVPRADVKRTAQKYSTPPSAGSIIVHNDQEEWDLKAPTLHAADARHDLHALRLQIATGAGLPPHWFGDSLEINLATASVMERAAVRHLLRRQKEIKHLIIDLCHVAYQRAYETAGWRRTPDRKAISIELPDISRDDNVMLAEAGRELAAAFSGLMPMLRLKSDTLRDKVLTLLFQFIGEPLEDSEREAILKELGEIEEWPETGPQGWPGQGGPGQGESGQGGPSGQSGRTRTSRLNGHRRAAVLMGVDDGPA